MFVSHSTDNRYNANWISQALGIELRFYDDEENELAVYHID
jgi:DNA helicase IV